MPHRVDVDVGAWPGRAELLERAVGAALAEVSEAEISLVLVDDASIAELHARYLGREGPTDVLAFSLGEPGEVLGDVYVCLPVAEGQALEAGVPLDEELVRLAVHGTLHVLGYDHPEGPERLESAMFRRQEEIVGEVLENRRTD